MKKKTLIFYQALIFVAAVSCAFAVDISLDGFKVNGSKSSSVVGYVDIEKVFEQHPLTKRLQDEFNAEAAKMKADIDSARGSISFTENIIASSSTALLQMKVELDLMKANFAQQQAMPPPPPPVAVSTDTASVAVSTGAFGQASSTEPARTVITAATIAAKEKEIKDCEAEIAKSKTEVEKKKSELIKQVDRNRKTLEALEEKNTNTVLQDLYSILEKITLEENLSLIVDKTNVLYGQPAQEYTDKVLERLRGR